jgi:hypothetical protein
MSIEDHQAAHEHDLVEALDNGILTCADPARLQNICDGLSAEKIDGLLRKWLRPLPHPFTGADRAAGYRYDISILQAEFSLTQVLDRPAHGRLLCAVVRFLDTGHFALETHASEIAESIRDFLK